MRVDIGKGTDEEVREGLRVLEAHAEEQQRKARRERIATAALTGLVIGAGIAPDSGPFYAAQCVILADALMAELDKEK